LSDWHLIVPLLDSFLDQWAALLSRIPEGAALAVILLPVALAIFSKRMAIVLGCLLLAVIAFFAFFAPSNTPVILATGIYLGSLVIALSGISARRKATALRAELTKLREDVNALSAAEERRFMRQLKSTIGERGG